MRAQDIDALVSVGRPALSPDGAFAIFATSRPDLSANRDVGQLWRIDLPHGAPRRLTRGVADASPRLRPDGGAVAFLREDAKGRRQIFVVAAAGGEPVQTTDAPLGVGAFAWSPDGATLAFTARVPERGRYGSVEGLDAAAEAPRRITGIRWHANGLGYIGDRPSHLFVVPAPDLDAEPLYEPAARVRAEGSDGPHARAVPADATQLTHGSASYGAPVFTADGGHVLAIVETIEHEARDLRSRIVAVAVDGAGERTVLGPEAGLAVSEVAVAPDGALFLLAYDVGEDGRDFVAPGTGLWHLDAAGAHPLTDPETVDLGEVGSHIGFDGDDLLVQDRTRGRVHLLRVTRKGRSSVVLGGDVEVLGHAAAGGRIVVAIGTPTSFGELAEVVDGRPRLLTTFGEALGAAGLVQPAEVTIPARDGHPVHGWVAVPDGEGPFPVILQIHGGPFAAYGIRAFDETQVLVDAGYAVVYGNPRGSAGYGRAHGRSIRQAMGTLDFTDVIDLLEGVVAADERLDADRVGIMGGSYGGYLTAWTIAHDHRFAAAIVERGFLDPVAFAGTSDIGSFFGDEYVGTDPEAMAAQSPMAMVSQVRKPTLVMHSELDFRCPLEQATRYYTALKRQGTPAEMLIFPGEDHELTRGGRPRHRVERFAAVLDWWNRYLPIVP
ncbi:S9 family peptidase [Microbacterium sp. zg.Y625]|uniref:alpha/beta hydrolase family protein n=1 Tax=Microbacterium jiangjiandongii TaxID=3049071 RepID=UPI00214AD135|nr:MULTISPECIES: S9 family peptidase [unclassified Microbacterium]MCR2792603.1 S9 family peptidase [Microbacterium sp. zg.Y625]WIM26589.1 S9 family peptidase [Microbacterium sp. zg-Y625]